MQQKITCIKCGIEEEPEWVNIIQSLLQTNDHWAVLRYMIGLVKRIQQRSNNSTIIHTSPYECYDSDSDDWDEMD